MNSIWSLDSKILKFKSLDSDINTKVCVIGGGITGILTTYLLHKEGIDCVLIEANTIASGVTPNTSAKITCQHGLLYNKMIEAFSFDQAFAYARANLDALDLYDKIIKEDKIPCDFERIPTYLYTTADQRVLDLELELSAMESLGLKGSLTTETSLPFQVKLALKMENQAQFNPLAFLSSISAKLPIYENTKALEIENDTVISTGGKIKADQIIVTTHFPFINAPGYYFARMHQERSYVTALKNAGSLDGAYLGVDDIEIGRAHV